jgi:hypothetical protein
MLANNWFGIHARMAGKADTEQMRILLFDGRRMRVG